MIAIILNILYSLVLGTSVVIVILKDPKLLRRLEFIAVSYLLGFGLITCFLFFFILSGISNDLLLSSVSITILLTLFLSIYFFKERWITLYRSFNSINRFSLDTLSYIIIGILLVQVIFVFMKSFALGPVNWDSFAIWSMKAKLLYYVGLSPILEGEAGHPSYPLLNSIGQFWVYLLHGKLNDALGKLIIPLIYLSTLIFMFSHFNRFTSVKISLIFILFFTQLGTVLSNASSAYSDLIISSFYFISVIYLIDFFKKPSTVVLILSSLFLGLCSWTKNEGIAFYAVNTFIFFLFSFKIKDKTIKERIVYLVIYASIPLFFFVPWKVLVGMHNITTNLFTGSLIEQFGSNFIIRLPIIIWTFIKTAFFDARLGFISFIAIISYGISIKILIKSKIKIASLAVIFNFLIYFSIYIISPHNIEWHLNTSLLRLFLQMLPLILFSSMFLFISFFENIPYIQNRHIRNFLSEIKTNVLN